MKIGIIGDKFVDDEVKAIPMIASAVDLFGFKTNVILTGHEEGVEKYARKFAYQRGYDCVEFLPHYVMDRRTSYSIRQEFIKYYQLVNNCDRLVVIQKETPTEVLEGVVNYAKRHSVPVVVLTI